MTPEETSVRAPGQVATIATMGTVVSVAVRTAGPDDTSASIAAAADRLDAIDRAFSPWLPDSWVSRLIENRVALGECPPEVQHVVELSMRLGELTDGYFSPYWRRTRSDGTGPDPTGLVKGWAAQQASDVLLAHGLPDHIVNAAGDLVVSGRARRGPDPGAWRVGIADPLRPGELAGVLELPAGPARWAVATSGTAELGCHVRDPHTGRYPGAIGAATVLTRLDAFEEGGAAADACATALVAAGDRAPALQEHLVSAGVDALLIEADGSVRDPRSLLGA